MLGVQCRRLIGRFAQRGWRSTRASICPNSNKAGRRGSSQIRLPRRRCRRVASHRCGVRAEEGSARAQSGLSIAMQYGLRLTRIELRAHASHGPSVRSRTTRKRASCFVTSHAAGDARAFRRAVDQLVQPGRERRSTRSRASGARVHSGQRCAHQLSAGSYRSARRAAPHATVSIPYSLEYDQSHGDARGRSHERRTRDPGR